MIGDYVMTEHELPRHARGRRPGRPGGLRHGFAQHPALRRRPGPRPQRGRRPGRRLPAPYPDRLSARSCPRPAECYEPAGAGLPVGQLHIAYGSIRMEPVFMVLGQSAATAAVRRSTPARPCRKCLMTKLRDRLLGRQTSARIYGAGESESRGKCASESAGMANTAGSWQGKGLLTHCACAARDSAPRPVCAWPCPSGENTLTAHQDRRHVGTECQVNRQPRASGTASGSSCASSLRSKICN